MALCRREAPALPSQGEPAPIVMAVRERTGKTSALVVEHRR